MSLSALFTCANGCRVSEWTAGTVDQILIEDTTYLKGLGNQTNSDGETLSPTYLSDQARLSTMTAGLTKTDQPLNEATNQNESPSEANKQNESPNETTKQIQ